MQFQVVNIQACNDNIVQYILIRSGVEISVWTVMHTSLHMQKYMYAYRVTCVYIRAYKQIEKMCLSVCLFTSGRLLWPKLPAVADNQSWTHVFSEAAIWLRELFQVHKILLFCAVNIEVDEKDCKLRKFR